MSADIPFGEIFFADQIKEITVSSLERTVFPYKAHSIIFQGGMVTLQMLPGRPINMNKNERVSVAFVKQNTVYRFKAIVQTYGVRGPLKLVAQPASDIEMVTKREHQRIDCQIQVYMAERVEIRGRWGTKVEESATIQNISGAGVLVRAQYQTKIGSIFKIRFILPNNTQTISAYMEVVCQEPDFSEGSEGCQLIAMRFLALPEMMLQAIEQYVENILASQAG
jgi:c-di-GMP-binding flagellar brake protein YcgR